MTGSLRSRPARVGRARVERDARVWTWLSTLGERRRQAKERAYWALREAEAMRMQHEGRAEAVCDARLADGALPARRRRFLTLVRRQLAKV